MMRFCANPHKASNTVRALVSMTSSKTLAATSARGARLVTARVSTSVSTPLTMSRSNTGGSKVPVSSDSRRAECKPKKTWLLLTNPASCFLSNSS